MYTATFLADVPLCRATLSKGKRVLKDYEVRHTVSPLTYKLILASWQDKRITSSLVSQLTKAPTSLVFRKLEEELRLVSLSERKEKESPFLQVFEVSEIKPFGRERRIDYELKNFKELFEDGRRCKFSIEELRACGSNTPVDLLVLLLSKRPQKKNYSEFLAMYLLGIPLVFLDELEKEGLAFSYVQRINRARERVLKACKLLNLSVSYELTRIPVGRYTARWFKVLEFK